MRKWTEERRERQEATMIERFGEDWKIELSRKGGAAKVPKDFAKNLALASRVGKIGASRTKPR